MMLQTIQMWGKMIQINTENALKVTFCENRIAHGVNFGSYVTMSHMTWNEVHKFYTLLKYWMTASFK